MGRGSALALEPAELFSSPFRQGKAVLVFCGLFLLGLCTVAQLRFP